MKKNNRPTARQQEKGANINLMKTTVEKSVGNPLKKMHMFRAKAAISLVAKNSVLASRLTSPMTNVSSLVHKWA